MKKSIIKFIIIITLVYLGLSNIYKDKLPNIKESIFFLQKQQHSLAVFSDNFVKTYQIVKKNKKAQQKYFQTKKMKKSALQLLAASDYQISKYQKALRFYKKRRSTLIPAQVISRTPDSWYSYIIINLGVKDGVKIKDPVITGKGVVGEISEVFKDHSKVILVSDKNTRISCEIKRTGEYGVTEGKLFNKIKLNYLPSSSKLKIGDIVATSGLSNNYPKGVNIGKIQKINKIKGAIFQEIELSPLVNLSTLDLVFVLKGTY